MTRRSTRTSECTSIISKMHDDVSTNAILVTIKKKYATVKNTSKSSVIQTQLSSHSTSAMPQITTTTIPKGPSIHEGTLNTSVTLWFQNH